MDFSEELEALRSGVAGSPPAIGSVAPSTSGKTTLISAILLEALPLPLSAGCRHG